MTKRKKSVVDVEAKNIPTFEDVMERYDEAWKEIYCGDHNKKYAYCGGYKWLIWSLPSGFTCPNATSECMALCYARKAEKAYPDAMPSRVNNLLWSLRDDFVDVMSSLIIKSAKNMRKAKLLFRIHESGDFYSKQYVEKWFRIMQLVYDAVGDKVLFLAYTKSFSFFDGVQLPCNFILRASIWDDTKPEDLEIIRKNHWLTYSAVEQFTDNDTFTHCTCCACGECATPCWSVEYVDIRVEKH